VVDQTDLTIAEDHLGWKFDNSGPGHYVADEWAFGDVLHEGSVTLDDLSAIAGNLGASWGMTDTPSPVPEPSALTLLGAAAIALLEYARRRRAT
jgi:hypothetical protein